MTKIGILASTLVLVLVATPALGQRRHHDSPEVIMDRHGQGHVLVGSSCIVYYDRDGDRKSSNRHCSHDDRQRADRAMASYRERHHSGRKHYSGGAYGITVLHLRNGKYQATVSGTCTVYFNDRGGILTWLPDCTRGERADASVAVYQYRQSH